jgi:DNA-binding GntR family transcriptional regulator
MEELKSVYEIGLSPLREALMKLTSVGWCLRSIRVSG